MRRDVPPGWDHDPTSPRRRLPLVVLAAAGLVVAADLTLYQVGVVAHPWDGVFGRSSSERVLDLTHPVPDAAAGVAAYGCELVLLLIGGAGRWRNAPWQCLALGALLVGGGAVSVVLIATQALVATSWCALCLLSAAISFALLALGLPEARAALEEVRRRLDAGIPVGRALRSG